MARKHHRRRRRRTTHRVGVVHRRTRRHSRRRRVGAMALSPTSPMVQAGSVVLGYFVGDKLINPLVDKVAGTMDPKLIAAIEIAAGGALVLGKFGKRNMITVVGGGLIAGAGVKRALRAFGVITGYGQMPVIGKQMKGYQAMPVVGYNPQSSLNGYPTTSTPINGPSVSHQRIVGNVVTDDASGLLRSELVG